MITVMNGAPIQLVIINEATLLLSRSSNAAKKLQEPRILQLQDIANTIDI